MSRRSQFLHDQRRRAQRFVKRVGREWNEHCAMNGHILMSEHEDSSSDRPSDEAASPHEHDITPRDAETQVASADPPHRATSEPTRMLAVVPVRAEGEGPDAQPTRPSGTFVRPCLTVAAAVAVAGTVRAAVALV